MKRRSQEFEQSKKSSQKVETLLTAESSTALCNLLLSAIEQYGDAILEPRDLVAYLLGIVKSSQDPFIRNLAVELRSKDPFIHFSHDNSVVYYFTFGHTKPYTVALRYVSKGKYALTVEAANTPRITKDFYFPTNSNIIHSANITANGLS